MLLIFIVSIYILYSQYKYGPDYFLPMMFKPETYNYLVKITRRVKVNDEEGDSTFDSSVMNTEDIDLNDRNDSQDRLHDHDQDGDVRI